MRRILGKAHNWSIPHGQTKTCMDDDCGISSTQHVNKHGSWVTFFDFYRMYDDGDPGCLGGHLDALAIAYIERKNEETS